MMMRVIVHRLSIGLALGLGAAVLAWQSFSGDATPEADADRPLPELRVTLGASRKLVTTAGMSAADQANFDRSGNFLKPHLLVLTLPDSRRIELTSRSTLVRLDGLEHDASRDEIVTTLLVRRPVKPGRFQEVVADGLRSSFPDGAGVAGVPGFLAGLSFVPLSFAVSLVVAIAGSRAAPRVHKQHPGWFEVGDVARHQVQSVLDRRGGDQAVDGRQGASGQLGPGGDLSPNHGRLHIHRQNPAPGCDEQLTHPGVETAFLFARLQFVDAFPQFADGQDAQKHILIGQGRKLPGDPRITARAAKL